MATKEQQKRMLSVNQVAKRLSVGWTRVERWIKSGKLKAIDLNQDEPSSKPAYRIQEDVLNQFVESREVLPQQRRQQTKRRTHKHFN